MKETEIDEVCTTLFITADNLEFLYNQFSYDRAIKSKLSCIIFSYKQLQELINHEINLIEINNRLRSK